MQQRGAVAVEHALGIARGARGVAQRGSGVLVERRPFEVGRCLFDQVFVAQQMGQGDGRHFAALAQRNKALDRGQLVGNRRQLIGKAQIEEHIFIGRVVDDVADLLGKQPRVDGVRDRAHAGHGVIQFQMAVRVPGQRRDALAGLHAQTGQGIGQALGAMVHLAPAGAIHLGVGNVRDDFHLAMVRGRMLYQLRDQQILLLHQTQHRHQRCSFLSLPAPARWRRRALKFIAYMPTGK